MQILILKFRIINVLFQIIVLCVYLFYTDCIFISLKNIIFILLNIIFVSKNENNQLKLKHNLLCILYFCMYDNYIINY